MDTDDQEVEGGSGGGEVMEEEKESTGGPPQEQAKQKMQEDDLFGASDEDEDAALDMDSDAEDKPSSSSSSSKLSGKKRSHAGDDDVEEEEDEDEDEDADENAGRVRVRKPGEILSDDEDEDEGSDEEEGEGGFEDDDEDDDEDEEEEEKRPSKRSKSEGKAKKKRSRKSKSRGASRFFDTMADVNSEDEEEDEMGEKGATIEELNEDEKAANALVEARHAKNREMLNTDAAELAARYERQHREEAKRARAMRELHRGRGGGVGLGTVSQQALLPSIDDPTIWRLKCVPGRELQLVRSILMKHIDARLRGERRSTLKTAFCSGSKGYIYVEAFSELCAKEAILGLRGVYITSFAKVPLPEMTQCLSASVRKKPLKEGQFVRLRRGPLKNDLAKIVAIYDGGARALVMAVPRPDFNAAAIAKQEKEAAKEARELAKKEGRDPPKTASKSQASKIRPPQKHFSMLDAVNAGQEVAREQMSDDPSGPYYNFWNNDYYSNNGFLYKEVNCASFLNPDNVKPRLEELQLFQTRKSAEDDEDDEEDAEAAERNNNSLAALAAQIEGIEDGGEGGIAPFVAGDVVLVTGGDLKNLIAKVISVNPVTHLVQVVPVKNQSLASSEHLTIEASLLVKHITPGEHVKIVSGRDQGATGRVVSVFTADGENLAVILTDGVNTEIQCHINALQVSSEVSSGQGNLLGYELYDLVALSENETGCVTMVGQEKLRVLTHMDVVKEVFPMELIGKRNQQSQRSSAFDAQQNNVNVGDMVQVTQGTYAKSKGTVKHIYKGSFWLHSNNHLKNSGVFVVKGRQCVVAGMKRSAYELNQTSSLGGPGTKVNLHQGPNHKIAKDSMIGKTVKIIKGGFKGKLGNVRETSSTMLTVELLARVKIIKIEREKCIEVGDKNGEYVKKSFGDVSRDGGVWNASNNFLPETPLIYQSQTPRGNETPLHLGNDTPRGNETPGGGGDDFFKIGPRDYERAQEASSSSNKPPTPAPMGPPSSGYGGNAYASSAGGSAYSPTNSARSAYSPSYSTGGQINSPANSAYSPANSNYSPAPGEAGGGFLTGTGGSAIQPEAWEENMVVVFVDGHYIGKKGVLRSGMFGESMLNVSMIKDNGVCEYGYFQTNKSFLVLAEPPKTGYCKICAGKLRGNMGRVEAFMANDVIISSPMAETPFMVKKGFVAWIFNGEFERR